MLDANRENIVPYSDFFKLEAKPQCMPARIREYVLAFGKGLGRAAWPLKEPTRISGWKGVGVQIRKRKRNQKRMKEPIRVLQVLGTTGLGGAESRVMDLYRNIDRERVQFDFAVHTSKKGNFDEEIEALGGHIYRLPRFQGQ